MSDAPIATLVEKMAGWVAQQPEYPLLFLADRATRRRAARAVAYRLTLLPTVPADPGGMNRAAKRAVSRTIKKQYGRQAEQLSTKRARLLSKAYRYRDRYARLSLGRIEDLAAAGDERAQRFLDYWKAQQEALKEGDKE